MYIYIYTYTYIYICICRVSGAVKPETLPVGGSSKADMNAPGFRPGRRPRQPYDPARYPGTPMARMPSSTLIPLFCWFFFWGGGLSSLINNFKQKQGTLSNPIGCWATQMGNKLSWVVLS